MTNQNAATPGATKQLIQKFPGLTYSQLGSTGLWVSQAGFGTYRVDVSVPEHKEALAHALKFGINLIDTSSNYADGGAEKLIAETLNTYKIHRDEVVIISKGGYIQGQNTQRATEREAAGKPYPDICFFNDTLSHCIHPEFLDDQLKLSLERLQMPTLDGYLLHNPEYFLTWALENGWTEEHAKTEYYDRIKQAFQFLETQVADGKINFYGVSSNTFGLPYAEPDFTCLESLLEIADEISPNHHFKVIQLPVNLIESGGLTTINQPSGTSAITLAAEHQIGVLVNRPLNAIYNNQMLRLAEFNADKAPNTTEIEESILDLIDLEDFISDELNDELPGAMDEQDQLMRQFCIGQDLQQHWRHFSGYEHFSEAVKYHIAPKMDYLVYKLTDNHEMTSNLMQCIESYLRNLNATIKGLSDYYKSYSRQKTDQIKKRLHNADPDWATAKSLSQGVVRALRSTNGITCTLVGMRRIDYVEDILEELQTPVQTQNRTDSWNTLSMVPKA